MNLSLSYMGSNVVIMLTWLMLHFLIMQAIFPCELWLMEIFDEICNEIN